MQGAQERRRARCAQRLAQFLPDAFGYQRVQFAAGGDLPHQCGGFRGEGEPQRCEARHEPCRAQYPQRILDEGRADVAQHPRLDVTRAAPGIDQRAAVLVAGDGIDGEVAALQVLFQRHRRIGVDDEAAVAAPALALGARQRVFLAGMRVQEHREVAADGLEATCLHLLLGGADHHPVAVARIQPQQPVADRAADQVGLHAPSFTAGQAKPREAGTLRPAMRSPSGTALPLRRQS